MWICNGRILSHFWNIFHIMKKEGGKALFYIILNYCYSIEKKMYFVLFWLNVTRARSSTTRNNGKSIKSTTANPLGLPPHMHSFRCIWLIIPNAKLFSPYSKPRHGKLGFKQPSENAITGWYSALFSGHENEGHWKAEGRQKI